MCCCSVCQNRPTSLAAPYHVLPIQACTTSGPPSAPCPWRYAFPLSHAVCIAPCRKWAPPFFPPVSLHLFTPLCLCCIFIAPPNPCTSPSFSGSPTTSLTSILPLKYVRFFPFSFLLAFLPRLLMDHGLSGTYSHAFNCRKV